MNAVPISGTLVTSEPPIGLFVFVDLIKFVILPLLFLSIQLIFQYSRTYQPVFPASIVVVSVNCILSNLVRLYISFPTETLR